MPEPLAPMLRDTATIQDGVLTRAQLLASGVNRDLISSRLDSGRWQRLYPGVYAIFSGPPARTAQMWAAVLKAGNGAMLSHRTAAEADGMIPQPSGAIHLTVPACRHVADIPGVVLHRSRLAEEMIHPVRRPPRTRLEETVLDLAGSAANFDDAFDWLCLACGGRFTTPAALRKTMAGRGKLRWRGEIRVALGDISEGVLSGLERHYLTDVERPHHLPAGVRQVRARRGEQTQYRNVLYEEFGVVVETDGRAAHPDTAWRLDRARDNAAAAAGLTTLRYTWASVRFRPCEVAAEVAVVLRNRGWLGQPRRCGSHCPVLIHDRG